MPAYDVGTNLIADAVSENRLLKPAQFGHLPPDRLADVPHHLGCVEEGQVSGP